MATKEWMTAAEIAAYALREAAQTKSGVIRRAARENWNNRKQPDGSPAARRREGQGGGWEYHVSLLPRAAREDLAAQALTAPQPGVTSTKDTNHSKQPPQSPNDCELAGWQRAALEARLALLAEVDRLAVQCGRITARKALATAISEGDLTPALQALIPFASQRGGGVSAKTLRNWDAARRKGGNTALAPRPTTPKNDLPPAWMSRFMDLWATPSKPSIARCYETALKLGLEIPPLRTVQRQIKLLPEVVKNKGRMGPRELKQLKAFVRRDVSELWPTAVYIPDGHTFDAEVRHPAHGRPFRPEITTIIDAYTRRIVGWSIGLAENTDGTREALTHAVTTCGLFDILYSDRGPGFKNKVIAGYVARLRATTSHSLPYNSQARGVIERAHQMWIAAAKELPSFIGNDMDQEAKQRAYKNSRRALAQGLPSPLHMAWDSFMTWCGDQVAAYNNRPHSHLPKITDAETGKRRHQSPMDAWAAAEAGGWQADRLSDQEALELARPIERRKVARCEIKLFGNVYFAKELELFHGQQVLVYYDLHDANQVWVRTLSEELICIATWDGNKSSFFPVSQVEEARERRRKGRAKLLEGHLAEVEAEARPDLFINAPQEAQMPLLTAEETAAAEAEFARLSAAAAPIASLADVAAAAERPSFHHDSEMAAWMLAHPNRMSTHDAAYLAELMAMSTWRQLFQAEGLDLAELEDLVFSKGRKRA